MSTGSSFVGVAVEVDFRAGTHLLRLVVGTGPEGVRLDDGGTKSLLREPPRHLGGGGRLPRTLQPGEEDGLVFERDFRTLADEADEFLVDDTEDVVAGRRPARRFFLQRALLDGRGEVHDETHVHVGLEKRTLNFLYNFLDIVFADA